MLNPENNSPETRSPQKPESDIFDVLELLSELDKIDDKAISFFRNTRIKERLRGVFDRHPEDQKIFLAVDNLSQGKLEKLKRLAVEGDTTLPGIHNISSLLSNLALLTGDVKYSVDRGKE